ncbi:MAG: hypothetical protein FK733_17245 [Asgard group archaeon]|nr:hypothetical protein [Asgard group archaeon]
MTEIKIKHIFFVILCIGLVTNLYGNYVSASFPGEFYEGENFTWTIDFINEELTDWWNGTDLINWHAENNSEVIFIVDDYLTIDDTDYLAGELSIGNLTLQTNCQEIGFNLALSVITWYGGLVSLEENWYDLHSIPPMDNVTKAQIVYDIEVTILGQLINAIQINYDDGFQQSTFVYDPITGILLSANTVSGSFHLIMHLSDTSMPLPSVTSGLPLCGLTCALSGIGFLVISFKKRKFIKG